MNEVLIIGQRIWAARSLRELSIRQLAREAGMSKSALHRYECGQVACPPSWRLVDLAGVLDVDAMWLAAADNRPPCRNPADSAWIRDRLSQYNAAEVRPVSARYYPLR